eukprot:3211400-Prymnesium_polylepis.1
MSSACSRRRRRPSSSAAIVAPRVTMRTIEQAVVPGPRGPSSASFALQLRARRCAVPQGRQPGCGHGGAGRATLAQSTVSESFL